MAMKTPLLGLNPKVIYHKQRIDLLFPNISCKGTSLLPTTSCNAQSLFQRQSYRKFSATCAVLSGVDDIETSSSPSSELDENFSVITTGATGGGELKINVEVSGAKTQAIFDNVFDKMVAAAQPIPGFRRVKGGKTPGIPRNVLLEILGPCKVKKQVIQKVISSTIAEYVRKEGLKVGKDLRVEQSFEDLEDAFKPGEKFSFNAVIHIQEKA